MKSSGMGSLGIMQAATAIGQFQRLAALVDPSNGDERWNALQGWLENNPDYRAKIEEGVTLAPDVVLNGIVSDICKRYDIPEAAILVFDSRGEIRQKAIAAIRNIQELYKERERKSDGK